MKIPSQHIDLGPVGYDGYWVEMPRSVKEGFLHEFAKLGSQVADDDPEAFDKSRLTNIKLLELITAWNIDDEGGKVYPVMSQIKSKTEREKVIADLPIDLIVFLANRVSGNVNVPEAVKDF